MSTPAALDRGKIRLAVIIVSFNTREITLRCLKTLFAALGSTPQVESEVWVVDNASHDGSVAATESEFPDVRVIANSENHGFGKANNQAMKSSDAEYFLLLNSDAFIIGDAIGVLLRYLQAHSEVAIVGPQLLNRDGTLQASCWKFPSPSRVWLENLGIASLFPHTSSFGDYFKWAHDSERDVDFVSGACFLIRREDYQKTGGFDEDFALYAEETDWQKRLTKRGRKIAFTPDAKVTHLGGASGGGTAITKRKFFDGLDIYTRKHHGVAGVLLMRAGMIIGSGARAILWTGLGILPSRRVAAREKLQLHWWLLLRQATHWKWPS